MTRSTSSEASIVASREDDTGHAIYQVTLDGLGTAAATQRSEVSQRCPESVTRTGRTAEDDIEFREYLVRGFERERRLPPRGRVLELARARRAAVDSAVETWTRHRDSRARRPTA
jgi:hypothetical protein